MLLLKMMKALLPPILFKTIKSLKLKFFNSNKYGFSGPYALSSNVDCDDIWTSNYWIKLSKSKLANSSKKSPNGRTNSQILITLINDISINRVCEILDWGGGTGDAYFNIQHFITNKQNVVWNVVDNALLSKLGQEYAKNKNLKIFFSENILKEKKIDIFYCNTSFQYIDDYKILFDQLTIKPKFVVLTRLLVARKEKVVMKQKVNGLNTICIFHDLSILRNFFKIQGYEIIYDLPNFEEVNFLFQFLPKDFSSKYGASFSRDIIFKKQTS
tara:strand:- start:215 stop:1027 length:813 start_codon:yes stop_codon:yes gene_type:complete